MTEALRLFSPENEPDPRLRAYHRATELKSDEELRRLVAGEALVFVEAIEGLIANRARQRAQQRGRPRGSR